ncbi:D-alanine--D-alanine ligase [Enterobacteriaceae endosymbiont of Neohaemonia nigricornis]|uniref:D-alanine--D-alanine ligase n=1 Tax=Enterobacteriaceae endosymbiont of Neohaemonia nigricornis TaxID=2675792 RepID=UPI0014493460|nr:D-alanine--D-alanine ligase [Enterobacteriaceae endosymbiont of Neohaemonia nigricornis]QJC30345.1 D-alanine--D-alanine ligase [Enterobacteriaceae endosymbiont of Neohaemonia nigricornis]
MSNKIAVLFGGKSLEKNISLQSCKAILRALKKLKISAYGLDICDFPIFNLKKYGFTKVFIAVHGKFGEDGILQSILDYINIPYTGSRMLPTAITINKHLTKTIWKAYNLPVYPHFLLNKIDFTEKNYINIKNKCLSLKLPIFIKPNCSGSSLGIIKINSIDKLLMGIEKAFNYSNEILLEKYIQGTEYTIGILNNITLPIIKIDYPGIFYDYNNKYNNNLTKYLCPSDLTQQKEYELSQLALKAWNILNCSGWGRIDVILDKKKSFQLLEINTVPGMTKNSLYPKAAKQYGLSFNKLVLSILNMAR